MLKFYQIIIAEGEAKRAAFEDSISNLSAKGKETMRSISATTFYSIDQTELEAVAAVSRKIEAASLARTKGYPVNFEFQLLMMYFAKLIYVLGMEGGSDSEAKSVLGHLFDILDKIISAHAMGQSWKDIGQLGFVRRKLQQKRRKNAIKSLFMSLNSRLLEAMKTIDPVIYTWAMFPLPKKASEVIETSAARDARVILKTLGKNQRREIEAILQRIIKPLAENVLSNLRTKEISAVAVVQLMDLRSHFIITEASLGANPSSSKPQAAGNKILLHLSYNPKTQLGMVLRLRAQMGKIFQLRFQPIGVNGTGGKGKEEEEAASVSIYHLPAEILSDIVSIIAKVNPTKQDIKRLFSAAASTFVIRQIIEDTGFEDMISRRVLGARHSRTREERRLGLEPNVAKRYKGVLSGLRFDKKKIKSLQGLADRNAVIYGEEGGDAYYPFIAFRSDKELEKLEKEPEEEEPESSLKRLRLARRISAWPWWYFRLLSNHLSQQSMTRRFGPESDGFSASVVDLMVWDDSGIKRRTDAESSTPVAVNRDTGFLLHIARKPDAASFDRWQKWSAGADLMVIPMQRLLHRAWEYTTESFKDGWKTEGPTRLTISVAEAMPLKGGPRQGKASYHKEVIILTSLNQKEMPENLVFRYKTKKHGEESFKKKKLTLDLRLILEIQQAYLGTSMVQFLNHKLQPRPYLQLQDLSLQHVHFPNPTSSLDLSGIAKELHELRFGPTNSIQVPKLACPASTLYKLRLEAGPKSLLLWDLLAKVNPATCFRGLNTLFIDGNVRIWESPMVEELSKFPALFSIILDHFPGNEEDLRHLAKKLQNIREGRGGVTISVNLDYDSDVLKNGGLGNVSFHEFKSIVESRFDPAWGNKEMLHLSYDSKEMQKAKNKSLV